LAEIKGLDMAINRSELSKALAKACAFKDCGKDDKAEQWARRLIELLGFEEILITDEILDTLEAAEDFLNCVY
jgi:hypothetical protein